MRTRTAVVPAAPGPDAAHFHDCPRDPACPFCGDGPARADAPDWSFLDGAYCISLESRDDRMAEAARQFHRVGLCRLVRFYRPAKHPSHAVTGIWESHRAVGMHALARSEDPILIMEDDVAFSPGLDARGVRRIGEAMGRLPGGWSIFFLGHWPFWATFHRPNVLRTRSACAHAYIASRRALEWLREHPYRKDGPPLLGLAGKGIDAAYAKLPGTFALFPMVAIQSGSLSDHLTFAPGRKRTKLKHLITHSRHREWLLSRLMRPNEYAIVALAPLAHVVGFGRRAWARLSPRRL
jgi:hypothetical protein